MQFDEISGLSKIDFSLENELPLHDRYQEDLKQYIDAIGREDLTTDQKAFVRKVFLAKLETKWYPLLGFDKSIIKNDIHELLAPKPAFKRRFNVKEALDSYNPSNNWLIPQLLRKAGLYILAGEPKTGKSILGYHLAYSVAISGKFLGKPVNQGKVLYLQLEETEDTISERTHFVGFGNKNNRDASLKVNFDPDCLVFERLFDATVDISYLTSTIINLNPSLVIIDSLRASTSNSAASEKDSDFGKLVAKIQQVFVYTNTCGVLIHHMNKAANQGGKKRCSLVNAVSGSTSIVSNSSGIIGLYVPNGSTYASGGSQEITLTTLPRNGFPITIKYRQNNTPEGLWELEPIGQPSGSMDTNLTGKILRYFATKTDTFISAKEIGTALETDQTTFEFRQSLIHLLATQVIVSKPGANSTVYCMGSDSVWMVEPRNIASEFSEAVLDANDMMCCQNKTSLYELSKDWSPERRKEARGLLIGEENKRLGELITTYLFDEGETVIYKNRIAKVISRLGKATLRDTLYCIEQAGKQIEVNEIDLDAYDGVDKPEEIVVEEEEPIQDF